MPVKKLYSLSDIPQPPSDADSTPITAAEVVKDKWAPLWFDLMGQQVVGTDAAAKAAKDAAEAMAKAAAGVQAG